MERATHSFVVSYLRANGISIYAPAPVVHVRYDALYCEPESCCLYIFWILWAFVLSNGDASRLDSAKVFTSTSSSTRGNRMGQRMRATQQQWRQSANSSDVDDDHNEFSMAQNEARCRIMFETSTHLNN